MPKKTRCIALSLILISLWWVAAPQALCAEDLGGMAAPNIELIVSAGPSFARTALPSMDPGLQGGLGGCFGAAIRSTSFSASPKLAGVGTVELSAFSFSQSAVTSDGQLYRAWCGLGVELLGGLILGPVALPLAGVPTEISLQAGAGLRASEYTGTGLVSAYPAVLARLAFSFAGAQGQTWGLALPFEYARKAGATVLIFGISGIWRIK